MSHKKLVRRRHEGRITSEAVAAFKAGDADALRGALRLRPWQWPSPLEVQDDEPCPYPKGSGGAEWWPECLALRRELTALANELDRLAAKEAV